MCYWGKYHRLMQPIIIFENDLRINLGEKINLINVTYSIDSNVTPEQSKTLVDIRLTRPDGHDRFRTLPNLLL